MSCEKSSNDLLFTKTLESHLKAISDKNFSQLKSTLPEDSTFYLILPETKTMTQKSEFLNIHQNWFKDTFWTFEANITHKYVGKTMGFAIVNVLYKEPLRNGKPYFNNMTISYVLEKINNKWVVILDHASSIEKSN